jgi:hypothetical protein
MKEPKVEPLSDAEAYVANEGCCAQCFSVMQVADGDDPTELCHSCVYEEVDRLRAREQQRIAAIRDALDVQAPEEVWAVFLTDHETEALEPMSDAPVCISEADAKEWAQSMRHCKPHVVRYVRAKDGE